MGLDAMVLVFWMLSFKPAFSLTLFLPQEPNEQYDRVLGDNIQKTKIMASGPIISWQIDGETMETVTDFIFLGSKITADDDCSHEMKRCLILAEKKLWQT